MDTLDGAIEYARILAPWLAVIGLVGCVTAPGNWDCDCVPGPADAVAIRNPPGNFVVTVSTTQTVDSIAVDVTNTLSASLNSVSHLFSSRMPSPAFSAGVWFSDAYVVVQ